ncbi:hypothetical protein AB0N89_37700, partial [Amycolatopsis sp. NPDC089917]
TAAAVQAGEMSAPELIELLGELRRASAVHSARVPFRAEFAKRPHLPAIRCCIVLVSVTVVWEES